MILELNRWGQVKRVCEQCGIIFYCEKHHVTKRPGGRFCSHKCSGLFRREKFNYLLKNENGKRVCKSCGVEKNLTEFSPDNRSRKRTRLCKNCKNEWMRLHHKNNPMHYRNKGLIERYGIDGNRYDEILKEQGGVCAICNKPESSKRRWLHVDHNHTTGKVRGLLCGNCNTGIGKLGEDEKILSAAIEYLRRV